jgi:hypothetical protein
MDLDVLAERVPLPDQSNFRLFGREALNDLRRRHFFGGGRVEGSLAAFLRQAGQSENQTRSKNRKEKARREHASV